jgi:hypothetical protein
MSWVGSGGGDEMRLFQRLRLRLRRTAACDVRYTICDLRFAIGMFDWAGRFATSGLNMTELECVAGHRRWHYYYC